MQRKTKFWWISISSILICVILYAASKIELSLPLEDQGEKTIQGKIVHCDIYSLGKSSSKRHGAKMIIDTLENKELVLNFQENELKRIEELCDISANVELAYHASRLLIRPKIIYIADKLRVQE